MTTKKIRGKVLVSFMVLTILCLLIQTHCHPVLELLGKFKEEKCDIVVTSDILEEKGKGWRRKYVPYSYLHSMAQCHSKIEVYFK